MSLVAGQPDIWVMIRYMPRGKKATEQRIEDSRISGLDSGPTHSTGCRAKVDEPRSSSKH